MPNHLRSFQLSPEPHEAEAQQILLQHLCGAPERKWLPLVCPPSSLCACFRVVDVADVVCFLSVCPSCCACCQCCSIGIANGVSHSHLCYNVAQALPYYWYKVNIANDASHDSLVLRCGSFKALLSNTLTRI